jgi:hypothetical protein
MALRRIHAPSPWTVKRPRFLVVLATVASLVGTTALVVVLPAQPAAAYNVCLDPGESRVSTSA